MAEKSIKKNFIFNIAYQLLILLMPLITTPYLSRVLGADGIGVYSYANSIVSYFLLFAVLGTGVFGQRAIGYVQQNVEERSRAFWETFLLRLCTCLTTLVAYAIFVAFATNSSELIIYLILALNIFNVMLDITWFFQGMEEFGITVTTSTCFRILYVVLIFVLVKTSADLWMYILLTVLNSVLGNIILWCILPKYLCKVKSINPFRNIKSVIQLFIPTIATQIYAVLDKSMIGWFSDSYTENGYYEQAEKIVKITLTAVTALGTVMIPRISRCYKDGDIVKVKYYIYKSYQFIWLLAIPIAIGLAVIASFFVPIFLGAGYEKCVLLIIILSSLPIFIGLSNVTGLQYFVPTGKQNWLTVTVVVGAIVNLVLNLCLIPFLFSVGAAIASVIAEACVTFVGFLYLWKTHNFSVRKIFLSSWKYWIAGIIMCLAVMIVKYFIPVAIWSIVLLIFIGVVVYFLMLMLLRDELVLEMLSKSFLFIKSRLKHSALKLNNVSDNPDKEKSRLLFNNESVNNSCGDGLMKYDYLIVGAGLFGSVFAHEANGKSKKVLVIDKRPNIAGNIYTEVIEDINVHKYGAHIFHTNNKEVWNYVNQFAEFNRYTNSPVANYKGELYSLPFNMYTFNKMWGVTTPDEAEAEIKRQREKAGIVEPENLEEQAISLVGTDIYEKLVKGYTQKQWGRPCTELPSFIIKRLPVRLTFDNNYFNALHQGIPIGGYTKMIEKMLDGIEVKLNCDYLENKHELDKVADKIIYTGAIDAYYGFKYGALEYRSVRFETEILDKPNFQGNAVVNYTDAETPFTRIIEHKFFEFGTQPKTVISREYSSEWKQGDEPYYPVNDDKNSVLYQKYKSLANKEDKVVFGGRLGEYKYYDMDKVIESALQLCKKIL